MEERCVSKMMYAMGPCRRDARQAQRKTYLSAAKSERDDFGHVCEERKGM